MAYNFPNSPAIGDMVSGGTNGAIYRWDGVKWALAGPPPSTVQSFNARTGAVTLAGGDVSLAQGYTSYNAANPSAYIPDAANDGVAYVRRSRAWTNGDTRYMQQATADAQYVRLDGTVPMTGALTLSGAPTLSQHAASKAYADARPFVVTTAGAATVTGTTTETSLAQLRIPGGIMGANGVIEVCTLWSCTNSANTKTMLVRLGTAAGTIAGGLISANMGGTTIASLQGFNVIRNNNATNAQVMQNGNGGAPFGSSAGGVFRVTLDTTVDFWLNVNAILANAADSITIEHAYAVVFPHA